MKKSLFSSVYSLFFALVLTLTSVMGRGQTFIMNNSSSLPTGWNKTARSQFVISYAGQAQLQLYGPSGGVEGEVFTTFTFTNVTGISFNGTGSNAVTLTGLYSTDGIAWTSFGTVNIVKNSSSNSDYSYSDVSDLSGKTIYLKFRSSASSSYLKTITVTTSSSPCTTPSFSSNPSNSTISAGGNTSFSVLASNATSYQWQVNTGSTWSNISNGGVYSDATTSTLNITGATTAMNGYQYRCVATNTGDGTCSAATASSPAATLTVNALPAPEINIKQGSTNIASGGSYNFGNQLVGNATSAVTFTIENTGNANLVLSGSPIVANSNTTEFTVNQTTTSTPVSGPGSTTFTVVFTPSGLGSRTATLSIANNDADEGTYTIVLNGTGVYSSASDIVDSGDAAFYTGTNNHLYANYQSTTITNTGGSVPVFRFQVRDGGAANNDTDDKPTTLTGLSFNYTGTANTIRAAALFNGNSKVADGTVTANGISFSGLSVEALDNANSVHITLRVTFGATVTDNEQLQFTVSSATADATGSLFSASNAGGAASSITGDRNRIEVVATKLQFSTVSNGSVNVALPSFTITANDANNNTDLDVTSASVTISASVTGVSGNTGFSINDGLATVTTVKFDAIHAGVTLSAAYSALTGTSNTFNIVNESYSQNAFLSRTGTGTYTAASSWSKCMSASCTGLVPGDGGWSALGAQFTPGSTATIYVQGTITGANNGVANATILSGGDLEVTGNVPISSSLTIKDGGSLHLNYGGLMTVASIATFTVENNASLYLNNRINNPTTSIWGGQETFYPNSNLYVNNYRADNSNQYLVNNDVNARTFYGVTAVFGNVYIDAIIPTVNSANNDAITDINNNGFGGGNWTMIGPSNISPLNLTHGNFVFRKAPQNIKDQCSCGSGTLGYKVPRFVSENMASDFQINIGGDLKIETTWVGSAMFSTKSNVTLNIKKDLVLESSTFTLKGGNAANPTTVNVLGNTTLSNSSILQFNSQSYTAAAGGSVLNLKGNLKTGASTSIVSNAPLGDNNLNFNGTNLQLIDVATTIAPSSSSTTKGFTIKINNGAKTQLNNSNLLINNTSSFTVESGGTFDFGYDGTDGAGNGSLFIGQPSTSYGTNTFNSDSGSILKITSPDGLYGNYSTTNYPSVTATTGNLRLSKSNRTINPLGTFWYIGKTNQSTGDAPNSTYSTTANAKIVIADLPNSNTLALNVSFGVSGTGLVDIRKGTFLETENYYVFGSDGNLKMAADTYYRIVKGDSANPTTEGASGGTYIPRMIGIYTLNGGTIELAGTGTTHGYQTLRGNKIYNNLTFSGGAIKTVSNSAMSDINGLVAVMDNTTLDVRRTSFNSFGKDVTTLRMYANSKFILDGTGTRPQLGGAYTLDPNSEIEFAGTAATQIRTQGTVAGAGTVNYAKVVVSGTNVTAGSTDDAGITFQNNGLFTVKTNATFKVPNKTGFTGSGTSSLKNADNLTAITLEPNSNIEYNRADDKDQSITTKINGTSPATYNYQNLIISGTGTKTPAEKDLIVNNVTNVSAGILQIPETLTETQNPYVLTSKKGIQVAALGQAIFGTNAQLMQDDGATNSGIVKVERKVAVPASAIPQFTYWSSPVVPEASASGTFFKTIFPGYTANALYYNEKNDRFYNSSGAFIQGRALAVQNPIAGGGALTAEMKGTPFNGSASFNMTMNGAGYNLVGNPYPSTISLQQLYTLNGGSINGNDENGKIDATFLLWDNTFNKDDEQYGSNYKGYSYSTYNAKGSGTGSPASNNGKKAEYGTASIGQGFMVRAIKQSDKVLTFDNSIRNSGKSVFFRGEGDSTKVDAGKFWLRLTTPKDRFCTIAVTYTKGASNALDNFDSKANGNSSDMLYSWLEDEKLVIQGRSFDFTQEDTVPLGMNNFESGSYTLSVWKTEGVFDVQQNIYIKDKLLNKVVNLSEGDYSFTSDSGVFTNRLEVVYKPAIVLGTEGITKKNVIVYREGNDFIVESEGSPILEVDCYDSAGRLVKKVVDHREKVALHAQDLPSGLYLLQIKHQQGTSVKRVLK